MEFTTYIRKPFVVQAVEITEDNIEEIAALVGDLVEENGTPHIALNRKIIPNVRRARIGWFLTLLGDNYRAYSPKVFNDQFVEHEPTTGYFFDKTEDEVVTRPEGLQYDHNAGAYVFDDSNPAEVEEDSDPTEADGVVRNVFVDAEVGLTVESARSVLALDPTK